MNNENLGVLPEEDGVLLCSLEGWTRKFFGQAENTVLALAIGGFLAGSPVNPCQ